MNPRNPPPIKPILAGYYDPDGQTSSPAVYASRRAALHEYTRQRFAAASPERETTAYCTSPLQHEMGGLDVLYASSDLLERAPGDAAGHQAIGNALWQEDNLWRVAARGCLHFPDQVMLSRGLILPALVPNLPADTYLLVRKLGSGKVGCGRLALCLEWGFNGTAHDVMALSGRQRTLDTAWATADMSLSEFHRHAVGPGLVWESGNSALCNTSLPLAPPPRVAQAVPAFFADQQDASIELPCTAVSAVEAADGAAGAGGAAAAAGGGAGAGPNPDDVYARAPQSMVDELQKEAARDADEGFLAGAMGGLRKLFGGGGNAAAAAPEPTEAQRHFTYGVGDIIGMQWDGAGNVSLVRNGAIVGRVRVWPEGQTVAAHPEALLAAVSEGGDAPLHWPQELNFCVLSTAGCEFEVVHHREMVDRMRRSVDGAFAEAYYAEYGPMPPHEGDLYPEAATRTVCL